MATVRAVAVVGLSSRLAVLTADALLHRSPSVIIHGIVLNPAKVAPHLLAHDHVKIFEASATDEQAIRAGLARTQICACYYIGDDKLIIDGQELLVEACVAGKVDRYIRFDFNLDTRGLEPRHLPIKDPMTVLERYFHRKKTEVGIVRVFNGAFAEVLLSPFLRILDGAKTVSYWGTGDEKVEITTMADIADFTASIALQPGLTGCLNVRGEQVNYENTRPAREGVPGTL